MRIGIGFDIHRLVEGRKLVLGGVEIEYSKGLLGHSDADVVLHAICDALLGAAGMGDIGEYFPDTNQRYKDLASVNFLNSTLEILNNKAFSIVNIDITIIAEEPNLAKFKKKISDNIAGYAGLDKNKVNVKASTMERLGEIGRAEAIAVYAVTLLEKQ